MVKKAVAFIKASGPEKAYDEFTNGKQFKDRDLYVIGGYDASSNSSAAVFVFDGQAWGFGPPLPTAVNHPGAAAIGNDVYVAGGFTPSGATNRVFVHTRGSVGWREIVPMQRARGALALLSIDGRLYAIGGRDGTTQIAVPEMYDPASIL